MKRRCVIMLVGLLGFGTACGTSSKDDADQSVLVDGMTLSPNARFLVTVEWPDELHAGDAGGNRAIVTFLLPDKNTPTTIAFTGFHPEMPTHGHGTLENEQTITVREGEPHIFDVSGIKFTMAGGAGDWVTKIVATIDGQEDTATVPISRAVK